MQKFWITKKIFYYFIAREGAKSFNQNVIKVYPSRAKQENSLEILYRDLFMNA